MREMFKSKKTIAIVCVAILIVVAITVLEIMVQKRMDLKEESKIETYDKHYAFITNLDDKGEMWEKAYEGAKEYGKEHGAYVEWFGKNLVEKYSKTDLLDMAILAKVDGIIVQGDDSSEMNKLVEKAYRAGIPLIAMWSDCYGSYRNSFVGMSSYNLGQEYGNYIIRNIQKDDGPTKVLVVINSNENDSSEKLIFAGMKETLYGVSTEAFDVETIVVNDSGTLTIEESVRNLLLTKEEPADVIVCLDENTTGVLARLVVDFNQVGNSEIIGFYSSSLILDYIDSGVISASLSVDATKLGEACVTSLDEYFESEFLGDYTPVEILTISKENVEEWLDEK